MLLYLCNFEITNTMEKGFGYEFVKAKEVVMNLRESLEKKVESQIDVWNRKIEELEAKAQRKKAEAKNEQLDAEVREDAAKTIKELRSKVNNAKEKLDDIKESGESELKKMKSDIESWLH